MSDFKNRIVTTAMVFALMATGCSDKGSSDSEQTTSEKMTTISAGTTEFSEPAEETEKTDENSEKNTPVQSLSDKETSESELFSDRDLNPDYSSPTAEITLTGSSAEVNGNGVSVNGSTVTITGEGIYIIKGTLNDGQVIVDADKNKVQLVLDNASISCSNSSAINVISAKKTFITLADGSKNFISDGAEYIFADSAENEPDAAVFSKDSLTINGNGELEVTGNYNDGIRSKDDIVITGGKITVNAVGDAIKGKDYVAVADGDFTLTAGKDGISSTNKTDTAMGFVYIEGGTFNINADGDGIQAETVFNAVGGDFTITSGGGSSANTKVHTDDFGGGGFGHGNRGDFDFGEDFNPEDFKRHGFDGDFNPEDFEKPDFDGGFKPEDFGNGLPEETTVNFTANLTFTADTETSGTDTVSTKGIKAGTEINISGGTFNINSADDTLHSDADVVVSGGVLTLDAGGKGIHADSKIDINDGTVSITNSYEGLESTVININNGTVEVNASDDGFNAGDGTIQVGMGTYSSDIILNINGGIVYVNASGDGLDSNGDININGGTVIVNGAENSGNGALDSNGEIVVTGGIVVAAGMSGMAECPSENSSQNSVSATFDSTYNGGTLITLSDDSGNEIISFAPEKSFDNIVISSPDIKTGVTYTFYTGGTSSASEKYGLYVNGGYNNDGTESGNFTAESSISFVGNRSGMGGGFGGGGGIHQPPQDGNGMPEMPDRGGKGFRQH